MVRAKVRLVTNSGVVSFAPQWADGEGTYNWLPEPLPPHSAIEIELATDWPMKSCRLHHSALIRMVGRSVIRADEDWKGGWQSPLTEPKQFEVPIGAPGYSLFPPLVIFGPNGGWLMGPTTENYARCLWDWCANHEGNLVITARLVSWGIGEEDLATKSEGWFIQRFEPGFELEPELFDRFHSAIAAQLGETPLQGRPNAGLTWASWNDGVYRDIDEARILGVSDYVRAELPEVKWVQIDDGWAGTAATIPGEDGELGMSALSAFYKSELLDRDPRFPRGMKGMAREIKRRGLRPMLWITPSVIVGSDLCNEHPEWILNDVKLDWATEMRFLDFSNPEVRGYVAGVLDLVFLEWGFEGAKLDFWTTGFQQPGVRLANPGKTSIEWMGWFLDQIRSRMPEDGLLLHCIGLPFGAPWRAKWCDHFRFYADTEGSCGNQAMVREQALWTAFLAGLYDVGRYWQPNGDGFGLFDQIQLPPNEHRRWAAFLVGSGTATELCGWLYQKADVEALKVVKTVAKHAAFGCRIETPGYDFSAEPPDPPEVWVRHDRNGGRLASLTNWSDEARDLMVPEGNWVEAFTGQAIEGRAKVQVPGRDGFLLLPTH